MVRIELHVELGYEVSAPGADFIFNIHPARTACQKVSQESLVVTPPVPVAVEFDPATGNRYARLQAPPGGLHVEYTATVELAHHAVDPADLEEVAVHALPLEALNYIYPSRYCESDRLSRLAIRQFGAHHRGHGRVQAIMEWVRQQVTYTSNASNSRTSAVDSLIEQGGVCRDFAHLMIALCRGLNIPARFVTGTDFGANPTAPGDFHAYVEVFLGGHWYIFDAAGNGIPMGFVRIGTGRDAADVAFATMFGPVRPLYAPLVHAVATLDPATGATLPAPTELALSTDYCGCD